jgi:hypothetical protein
VPKSTGTCTRCPLLISLEEVSVPNSEDWRCHISLYHAYDYIGAVPGHNAYSETGPFQHWIKKDIPNTVPFTSLDSGSRALLEETLIRAQSAILSPGADPLLFQDAPLPSLPARRVEFSPNSVQITITGVGMPSLSFVDLPGVIAQTTDVSVEWSIQN